MLPKEYNSVNSQWSGSMDGIHNRIFSRDGGFKTGSSGGGERLSMESHGVHLIVDEEECGRIWRENYPIQGIFDLWEVRAVFAGHYRRKPCFVVHETQDGIIDGVLPLGWIEEAGCFGFFPGETWNGRTWMEGNRIIARDSKVMAALIHGVPGPADIRYLLEQEVESPVLPCLDETGYLFYPMKVHGSLIHEERPFPFENYLGQFPGKSRKKLLSEIKAIERQGISFRLNDPLDIDHLFRLNLENFNGQSYFHDTRFMGAFKDLVLMLHKNNMLRIVTVLVNNEIAAVDMGAMLNSRCTIMAGGTSRAFPGIAKLINLNHIEWACRSGISLDFLCGDFGWKARFRLTPRPLYQISLPGR
ncbi:MAG: GNAT family N-acetyltransferase [Desulfamplus sp.]|nr:GNAT family N-acetyltransferase [Desulfamplus sp.]